MLFCVFVVCCFVVCVVMVDVMNVSRSELAWWGRVGGLQRSVMLLDGDEDECDGEEDDGDGDEKTCGASHSIHRLYQTSLAWA